MSEIREPVRNERGIALVVTIIVLLFLSLLATAMITSLTVESKLAGTTGRVDRALNTAEAGLAEAMERIRSGDVPDDMNPKMVAQIFLAEPGTVPTVGTDTTALPTFQPVSDWLTYSTPTRGADVLTVQYKTNAARTQIYRYDASKNPAIQTSSGPPIYVVTATGRYADSKRTIVTEVFQQPMKPYLKAAIVAKKKISAKQDHTYYCGYNHRIDTPEWTNLPDGRNGNSQACNDDLSKQMWEIGTGNLPGGWSEGKINDPSKADFYGSPATYQQNQSGFYTGIWDAFAMSRADFYNWIGPPKVIKTVKGPLDGIYYYDPDGKKGKNGGTLDLKNVEGEGLIYVEGDIHVKGQLVYRGLIYCTGTFNCNAKTWVLGGLICGKDMKLRSKKEEIAVLYSEDAIAYNIGKYNGPFVTLSWRERP